MTRTAVSRRSGKIIVAAGGALVALGMALGASAAKTELTFAIWDAGAADFWPPLIAEYEAAHPDVHINYEPIPNSQYDDKLSAAMAAGSPPDAFMVRLDVYPAWAKNGTLLDISPWIKGSPDMQAIWDRFPQMLALNQRRSTIDGKWYGLGYKFAFAHAYFNRNAFAESGLQPMPVDGSHPWSWDTWVSSLKKLTKSDSAGKQERWGFDMSIHWLRTGSLIRSFGDEFIGADHFDVASPKAKEAMQAIKALYQENLIEAPGHGSPRSHLVNGQAGIMLDISDDPHKQLGGATGDMSWYGLGAYPAGPGQSSASSYMFGENVAVSAHTAHPQEAAEFVKFIITRLWDVNGPTPFLYGKRALHPDETALAFDFAMTSTDVVRPFVGFDQQGKAKISKTWTDIFTGKAPFTALDDLQRRIDAGIKEELSGL